jgi:hypothetical protein
MSVHESSIISRVPVKKRTRTDLQNNFLHTLNGQRNHEKFYTPDNLTESDGVPSLKHYGSKRRPGLVQNALLKPNLPFFVAVNGRR